MKDFAELGVAAISTCGSKSNIFRSPVSNSAASPRVGRTSFVFPITTFSGIYRRRILGHNRNERNNIWTLSDMSGPQTIHNTDSDVYSPCALGGVLNPATLPEIRAKVIAGAANNQVSDQDQDRNLWAHGIAYCPDYVVNAGGVLSVADTGTELTRAVAFEQVGAFLATTRKLKLARSENLPTGEAADRLAQQRLRPPTP